MKTDLSTFAAGPDLRPRLEKREYRDAQGGCLPYRLFVPKDYNPSRQYPLIVFLHGAGERGNDNETQLKHDQVLRLVRDDVQAQHPSFLVAPQCPTGCRWVEVDWGDEQPHHTPDEPSVPMRRLLALLDELPKQYHLDPQRRYVTGMSMGGYGTLDLLVRRTDYWAAAVCVCGGGDDFRAAQIAGIPLWAFHGDRDTAVPVQRSRSLTAALKQAGGKPRYTEYPGASHFIWHKAYAEPELVEWLFAQKRP